MAARAVCALAAAALVAGCSWWDRPVRTVEVRVPVEVMPAPPAALAAAFTPAQLVPWVGANDPAASSCLTREGEAALRAWVTEFVARDSAWRAWVEQHRSR